MSNRTKNITTLALGTAMAAGLGMSSVAHAAPALDGASPFSVTVLSSGYALGEAADGKAKDGSCGEKAKAKDGSCGEKAKDGSCGEKGKAKDGSCGEKAGAMKGKKKGKAKDGKCGEGKCGS
ncbi:MAG: hypothetical protein KAI28_03445 [Sphingomonadales bacterium]|nr:hypothetical protein [Sphingomonadales bacterium]